MTDTPEPTATNPEPTPTHTPTATETQEPTATDTPDPTATGTATTTATSSPTATATSSPTATATPLLNPSCGNGTIDPGEECDDGALNSDTISDACRSNCQLPSCGDGVEDTAVADFLFVIETSLSMGRDLKRIPKVIGALPELTAAAGIDSRFALVRYGTGRLRKGPDLPDLMLDFTTDGDSFRDALTALHSRLTGPTESGTEALEFAMDHLQVRPGAIPVFLLFTDEDDDLPVWIERGRRREPPPRWLSDARTPQFQARLDAVADRLIELGARAIFVMKPQNRPSEFQYGSPRLTQLDSQERFDGPRTLLALSAEQMENSLQGQLLGSGRCESGRCVEGSVDYMCAFDEDCGLYARAHDIKTARRRKTRDQFYAALLGDLLDLAHCQP